MSKKRRNRDRKRRFKNKNNSTNKIISIDQEECIGCGQCVTACPFDAIQLVDGNAQVIENKCRGCKQCIRICPVQAITI
ncbi:MAG TPA: 4Fe-4S binding protein [Halanaerobiales bacterium]|nr:4Fe-4S binding protein [Halanaerobiales bacterium]